MSAQIGIRELKAKLSSCVKRAADGERIIVTDRGRPVAQLTNLDDATLDETNHIRQAIAEGWITPPRRNGPLGRAHPAESASGLTVRAALDEDRGG